MKLKTSRKFARNASFHDPLNDTFSGTGKCSCSLSDVRFEKVSSFRQVLHNVMVKFSLLFKIKGKDLQITTQKLGPKHLAFVACPGN